MEVCSASFSAAGRAATIKAAVTEVVPATEVGVTVPVPDTAVDLVRTMEEVTEEGMEADTAVGGMEADMVGRVPVRCTVEDMAAGMAVGMRRHPQERAEDSAEVPDLPWVPARVCSVEC